MPPSQEQTVETVLAFVNAQTSAECKEIVENLRALLLDTDAADTVLDALLALHRSSRQCHVR
jgi:hypothetical protein